MYNNYAENNHDISNYGYGHIKENILLSYIIICNTLKYCICIIMYIYRDPTFNLIYRIMYYLRILRILNILCIIL